MEDDISEEFQIWPRVCHCPDCASEGYWSYVNKTNHPDCIFN